MASLTQAQLNAANEFAQATIEAIGGERGAHAETAISGLARMAGTFLFRSFGFRIPEMKPGQPVLSEQANEEGPHLLNILGGTLMSLDVVVDQARVTG